MPLDPSLSTDIQYPQPANPLTTIGSYAGIQNQLNQNRLFQQTFAARQRAGQILAAAPDMETGIQQLSQDPLVAPFAGEIISPLREAQMFQAQYGGLLQNQATQGAEFGGKVMGPAMLSNPSSQSYAETRAGVLALVNPQIQDRVGSYLDHIATAAKPEMAPTDSGYNAALQKNLVGMGASLGMTPDQLKPFVPGAENVDVGGSVQPMLRMPSQGSPFYPGAAPGSLIPAGPGIGKTLPPGVSFQQSGAGGAVQPYFYGGSDGSAGTGTGNAALLTQLNNGAGSVSGAAPPPGLGAAPVLSPTQAQAQYNQTRGTDMANYQKNLDSNVSTGSIIQQSLGEARNALQDFHAGGGADAYAKLGQVAQAFGAPQPLVDKIGDGNLAAAQEFEKLMVNTTMGQIREQLNGVGASRLSQMEFKSFSDNNPNINTDPRAIGKIFDFWTRLYQRDRLEQQMLNQNIKSGGDISEWPQQWQSTIQGLQWSPSKQSFRTPGGKVYDMSPQE